MKRGWQAQGEIRNGWRYLETEKGLQGLVSLFKHKFLNCQVNKLDDQGEF